MKLTDAELAFEKSEKVRVYPAPFFTRSPEQKSDGWELRLLRGSLIVGYGRGETREAALEAARKTIKR